MTKLPPRRSWSLQVVREEYSPDTCAEFRRNLEENMTHDEARQAISQLDARSGDGPTARDLMRLPLAERDAHLRECADRAAQDPEYMAILRESDPFDAPRSVAVRGNPLCIYVAAPLSDPSYIGRHVNVTRAMEAGIALMRRGHYPLVPHLSQFLDDLAGSDGGRFPYEFWLALDFAWLERADAILHLAPSPGADRELAFAEERGLRVFRSLDAVPEVRP